MKILSILSLCLFSVVYGKKKKTCENGNWILGLDGLGARQESIDFDQFESIQYVEGSHSYFGKDKNGELKVFGLLEDAFLKKIEQMESIKRVVKFRTTNVSKTEMFSNQYAVLKEDNELVILAGMGSRKILHAMW